MWEAAVYNIDSLTNNRWIDYAALNVYLYYRWGRARATSVRYVVTQLLMEWNGIEEPVYQQRMSRAIIPNYRHNYGLAASGALPMIPLLFAVLENSHFFVVAMDASKRKVWVIGRSSWNERGGSWDEWHGPGIYKHLCLLHGWEPGNLDTVRTYSVVIPQDGVNCGPSAIRVALCIFERGLQFNRDGKLTCPPRLCPHLARMSILVELCRIFHICRANFDALRAQRPREWLMVSDHSHAAEDYRLPDDTVAALLDLTLDRLPDHAVFISLKDAILSCLACWSAGDVFRMWQRALENAETDGPDLDANAQPSTAEAPEGEQDPAIDVLGNEVAYDAVTALQVYEPRPRKQIRKYKSPKHPSLANPKRFPRPQEPEPIPQALGPIYLKHDDSFDDYDRGPTREEFIGPNTSLGDVDVLYGFDPVTEYLFPVSWTRFADQGMRLLTGYAHMHYMRKPWNIHAHVLPIAHLDYSLKDYYRTLHQADSHNEYMKAHRGHRRREEMEDFATSLFGVPSDVRFMGLGEMLSGAGRPGSAKNLDRFIRGRTSSGKLICLDIERDAVMVPPADVDVLMDIDSIIWVTSKVKVNMSINVATTPTVGKTPPIRKNNHVYVRVLQPPTHNERCDGMRDWAETATSLSIIPHTIFAKIVEGSCPINLIICFPRMLHRNSFTHKWEALIPFEIQRLFWDLVLLPALHECLGDADKPYVPVTVHNNQLKSASKEQKEGLLFRAKTASISPSVIWAMQDVMRRKVKEDPSLDLYGSFFFVIDAKNYKLQTRVPVSSSGEPQMSPWQALKAALPQLDLDYMADRSNGELTVDLAISFNPRKPTVPLVGLWRLDVLEASFGAGGYTRGSLHHIASLSRYGALQAPMGSERARQTHVVSRSSYNLQYEVIRASNNQPYFAEDGDAYEGHLIYRQECTRRVQIYRGECQQHTYGVRDEYRIGGEALQDFFTNWQDKVRFLSLLRTQDGCSLCPDSRVLGKRSDGLDSLRALV